MPTRSLLDAIEKHVATGFGDVEQSNGEALEG